jgi:excisionase family DNA binding protein
MKSWTIPENINNKTFFTPKELREILEISSATIYRLIEFRKLPVFKIGKSVRIMREDVISFLESNRIDQIK